MSSLILFIIALSLLIIAHETGHFLAAKRKGILVEEFGLGYPPRIWGKKIGETLYSLNWLPVGGFVRILGEVGEEKVPRKWRKRSLSCQSLWTRTMVALGGVTMNLLVAILIFALVYSFLGIPRRTERVRVVAVAPESPAAQAGLKEGDWLKGIFQEGELVEIKKMESLIQAAEKKAGETLEILVVRGQEERRVVLVPRLHPPEDEGPLGVIISQTETFKPPWWQRPFLGVREGFAEAYFWGKTIVRGVGEMVSDLFRGQLPANIAGPVGIYQATSEIQKQAGIWAVIHFFGILSVNLAIVNLLPFPALDGSRLLFLAWEAITRKRPNPKTEQLVYQVGMAILLFLLLVVTVGDIKRWGTR